MAVLMLAGLVGILSFGQRFLRWLAAFVGIPLSGSEETSGLVKAYPEVLIIIGIATFTTWIAIWRGQQAQRQIRETQRQVREQSFSNAIAMATSPGNDAQAIAGFTRLRHLLGDSSNMAGDKEGKEYLIAAQSAALNLLTQKAVASSETGYDLSFPVRRAVFIFLVENLLKNGGIRSGKMDMVPARDGESGDSKAMC